ncbi:MAG: glycine cleavage system protein GcvH [Actinomycetota bacterium]|nr:glycine cleavage system protein GcvH [Actinomycetota bacterium]
MIPTDRRYSQDHEWIQARNKKAVLGISDYVQEAFGEIVYVDIREVGTPIVAGEPLGEVESTKAIFELSSPVSGVILEVNSVVLQTPKLINTDPYGEGWLAIVKLSNLSELSSLMSAEEYKEFVEGSKP